MDRRVHSTTIVPIAQREQDDTEDDRSRDSIAPDDGDRVPDRHDLDRESREPFEESDEIKYEIHKKRV
jgi:hypothetical protein